MSAPQDTRRPPSHRARDDGNVVIYALVDPETHAIRYVGKTTWSLTHRLRAHLSDIKQAPHTHKARWINGLLRQGLRPRIITLDIVSPSDWERAERHWIRCFADTVTNETPGGEVGGWGWRRGERAPSARLTESDVVAISERFAVGGVTLRQLAEEYGVSVKAISLIVRGINWPHVERPLTFRLPGAKGITRNAGNRHGAKDYRPCA